MDENPRMPGVRAGRVCTWRCEGQRSQGGVNGTAVGSRAWLMLALARVGFAVNFWAWALLSPLAPRFPGAAGAGPLEQALLVAVPVV